MTLPLESPGLPGRLEQAALTLEVTADSLIDAARAFAGRARLGTPAARRLALGALAVVAEAPRGTLMIHDLAHTAEEWPKLPRTLPMLPWQAATLVDELYALLRDLGPEELAAAARGFTLLRYEIEPEPDPQEDEDGEEVFTVGESPLENRFAARLRARSAAVHALSETDPGDWSENETAAVRKAVLTHLASLGDVVIRVSEYAAAPLAWTEPAAGILAAAAALEGTPFPLEARLNAMRERPEPDAVLAERLPVWPHGDGIARPRAWEWEVGWTLASGTFLTHARSAEPTRTAAVFAAEQTVAALRAAAHHVRHPTTGRVLLPRAALTPDDPLLRIVTLRGLMEAVLALHAGYTRGPDQVGWADVPHSLEDGSLASYAAALCDQIGLPYAVFREGANDYPAGDARFLAFLRAQAVVMTPPAAAYLAGSDGAGRGEHPLEQRHEAGLRAAFTVAAGDQADLLVADLGPLPDGLSWLDLYDLESLRAFMEPG